MNCQKTDNLINCNCTCDPCPRKGICCECIHYHRRLGELPACYFSTAGERSYNRSIAHFVMTEMKGR